MRALLLLLFVAGVAEAAPRPIADADGLARWFGRLGRAKAGAAVEARSAQGALSLTGTVDKTDRRTRLLEAALSFGPLQAQGELEVLRTRRPTGWRITAALRAVTIGDVALGEGQLDATWSRRAGWAGTLFLQGGAAQAVRLRLAPIPKPVRCRRNQPCPAPAARLAVELDGLDLGPALAQSGRAWLAHAGGTVDVAGAIDGALDDLWGSLQINAAPTWDGRGMGALTLALRRPAAAPLATIEADLSGPLAGAVRLRATGPWRLDAEHGPRWRPGEARPTVALEAEALALAAWTNLFPRLAAEGQADLRLEYAADGAGALRVRGRGLRWRGAAVGRVDFDAALADDVVETQLVWGDPAQPNLRAKGTVPVTLDPRALDLGWRDAAEGRVALDVAGLTPKVLAPFWQAHPAADFTLGGRLTARGTLASLALEGTLTGALKDRDASPLPLSAHLNATAQAQTLNVKVGTVWTAEATAKAPLVAIRAGQTRWEPSPVTGKATLDLPLPTLAPYLPRMIYDPRGTLAGEVKLSGTLGAPSFDGQIVLPDGTLTLTPLRQRLRDVQLTADFAGDTLTFSRFEARSGVGTLRGGGKVELVATPPAMPPETRLWGAWQLTSALSVTLRQLPFVQDLTPAGLIDALVQIESRSGPGTTDVAVRVQQAAVRLTNVQLANPRAVPHNHRVQVLDWTGDRRADDRLFAGRGRLGFTLELVDPVPVEGDAINLTLGGTLKLERTETEATVEGGLDVLDGQFELFENAFVFERGRLSLQPGKLGEAAEAAGSSHATLRDPDTPPKAQPLEPVFEVVAVGRAVRTDVDVVVRGPARRPELQLASEPPLPEYRILTLLITGRVDAVDDRNGDVRRQVAKLVDRFHNPGLSRQLYDRLGVDKLGLGFGDSVSQPILTVGKQINRQLYVETVYHHNAPPDANEKEAHVQYRLDPRWTLDTVYGDAAQGSFGVFWKTDWGGPPPRSRAKKRPEASPSSVAPSGD